MAQAISPSPWRWLVFLALDQPLYIELTKTKKPWAWADRLGYGLLLLCRPDIDRNVTPLALIEPDHAQRKPRRVTDQDCDPDVKRLKRACLLDHEADAERDHYLRDDRDIERALRITGALKPARVCQRDSDEESRDAENTQQLCPDLEDDRIVHAE